VRDTGVAERVGQGVHDVTVYFSGGSAFSNLGIRLELWKGASMLIAEHPLTGQGIDSYQAALARYVAQGRLDPVVLPMPHVHNDALQALVTGGIVGFSIWLATLVAPFVFFARALVPDAQGGKRRLALALAGMLVVASYFSFGLTEVIFWSMKGSMFYALMIFLLMGFCLNAKDTDGK
jgi:O-antigen ligase